MRIKVITIVISIATVFIGIYQFNQGQTNTVILEQNLIAKRDSLNTINRLWEQKIKTYSDIGGSIGMILTHDKKDSIFDNCIRKFEILYYGESILVEDSVIALGMHDFKDDIRMYKKGYIDYDNLKLCGMALVNKIKKNVGDKRTFTIKQNK